MPVSLKLGNICVRKVEDVLPADQKFERAVAYGRDDGNLDRMRIVGEPDGMNTVIRHFGGAVKGSLGHIELFRMLARISARILEGGTR
jgi:hypothetical protein